MNRTLLVAWLSLAVVGCTPQGSIDTCESLCDGCCADGRCLDGDSASACGALGVSCQVCAASEECSATGQCVPASSQGGGAGSTGGGSGITGGGSTATGGGSGTTGGGSTATGGGSGTTGGGSTATGGGTGVCFPQTDEELCVEATRVCGPLTRTDRCGVNRVVTSCGSCTAPLVCGEGACVCQPESPAQLCTRLGATCGNVTTTDNCGTSRTVSCGTCSGVNSCAGGGVANQCGCTQESDAQLCARNGRSCGALTANDNCGVSRTVASCGTCVTPNTCSGSGQCGCTTETNAQFCARLGASCGSVSGVDLCNQPRSVSSCGSCAGSNACGGGGTANQCGCTPKTSAELCATANKNCGTITVANGCGTTVQANCGACGGVQTCGGGGTANVCGCTAETNSAFCARVGANCGSVTAADNCGTSRTVSCGASCSSPNTCGGGGSTNVCGCTGETEAALCALIGGGVCGATTRVDSCGVSRSLNCGGCAGGYTCGGAGIANRCGLPFDGEWRWVLPSVTGESLNAVYAVAPDDVWFAGESGTIVHWDGSTFTRASSGTLEHLNDVFATSASDVWVVGNNNVVLHSIADGGWETIGHDAGGNFNSVWGTSPTNMYLTKQNGRSVWRWNGFVWSNTVLTTNEAVTHIAGSSPTNIWAAGTRVWAFNGLDWVSRTPVSVGGGDTYRVEGLWVHSPTDVWVSSYYSNGSPTTYPVHRFDGGTWSNTINGALNVPYTHAGALWGSSGGDMWATENSSGTHRRVSPVDTWARVDGGFKPTDVHGSSANDVWFAGGFGQVGRWSNGANIEQLLSVPLRNCTEASVVDLSTAFEVCGKQLATINPTTGAYTLSAPLGMLATNEWLTDLWAASETQVWLTTSAGQILFFDGATASPVITFSGSNFTAIWGSSPTDIWAGTTSGGLLHWDGANWAPAGAPTYARISDIWGSGPNDVYAVGAQGGYLRWNGTTWSLVTVTMSPAFYAQQIRASGPNNVWALDGWSGGYALRFNGSTWQRFTVSNSNVLDALWVASEADVFISYDGTLYHYNGTSFVAHAVSGQSAHTLWGAGPRELLRFTANGLQRY